MSISQQVFGSMSDGRKVLLYTLKNNNGVSARITNYGGIIVSIMVPDKNGEVRDIALGYDNLEYYIKQNPFFGALVGRHANRIEDAVFTLNGKEYKLVKNNGNNHLHGGTVGFDKVLWDSELVNNDGVDSLKLTYTSVDGEENYPGNLDVTVLYTLTEENELKIEYSAVSDKDTVVNLTNHSYFNLAGHNSGDILNHEVYINSDSFTKVNDECIPTGEILDVKETPMDFSTMTPISKGIDSDYEQIEFVSGYDHNWVLNSNGDINIKAAEVYEPTSGIRMELYTTKPGVQLYTGNNLTTPNNGKDNAVYTKRSGLCLETQFYPNSLRHTHFPSPILKAGENYCHTTIYKFV